MNVVCVLFLQGVGLVRFAAQMPIAQHFKLLYLYGRKRDGNPENSINNLIFIAMTKKTSACVCTTQHEKTKLLKLCKILVT